MIGTLLRVSFTNLRRDRPVQVMAFVVPIVFFSIFALIFGARGGNGRMSAVDVAVVDEARTARSAALMKALQADTSLNVIADAAPAGAKAGAPKVALDRARAEALVRAGDVPVALVLPAGLDTSLARFDGGGRALPLLVDPSNPMAAAMVNGLLQRAALRVLEGELPAYLRGAGGAGGPQLSERMPARTERIEVVGEKRGNGMIAFYAAGIAVMFLLFSANGAAGALLDETDSGTLERVLSARVGMGTLLGAKWLYITLMGILQIVVMFAWGMLVFRLPLLAHLPGFAVVTVFTAGTAAAFALMLAASCRTRAQLQGLSTLVVLSLSAIGGSMFPRFLMPEFMQKISFVGFNAWALEAYLDVFWREAPLMQLLPRLGALVAFGILFAVIARRLARRWEMA